MFFSGGRWDECFRSLYGSIWGWRVLDFIKTLPPAREGVLFVTVKAEQQFCENLISGADQLGSKLPKRDREFIRHFVVTLGKYSYSPKY
jgi:hypothetical protein